MGKTFKTIFFICQLREVTNSLFTRGRPVQLGLTVWSGECRRAISWKAVDVGAWLCRWPIKSQTAQTQFQWRQCSDLLQICKDVCTACQMNSITHQSISIDFLLVLPVPMHFFKHLWIRLWCLQFSERRLWHAAFPTALLSVEKTSRWQMLQRTW